MAGGCLRGKDSGEGEGAGSGPEKGRGLDWILYVSSFDIKANRE